MYDGCYESSFQVVMKQTQMLLNHQKCNSMTRLGLRISTTISNNSSLPSGTYIHMTYNITKPHASSPILERSRCHVPLGPCAALRVIALRNSKYRNDLLYLQAKLQAVSAARLQVHTYRVNSFQVEYCSFHKSSLSEKNIMLPKFPTLWCSIVAPCSDTFSK